MIHIGGKTYEIVHEHRTAWNPEMFRDRYSEVLDRYDYIVGDWGYNQLRLKGFFKENNPKSTKDSSLSSVMDYINEYCNFGCAYFILEKKPSKDGRAHSTDVLDTDAEMEGAATAEELSDADVREQGISLVPRTSSAEETSDMSENGQEERISRAERHRRAERQFRTERSEKQERNGAVIAEIKNAERVRSVESVRNDIRNLIVIIALGINRINKSLLPIMENRMATDLEIWNANVPLKKFVHNII